MESLKMGHWYRLNDPVRPQEEADWWEEVATGSKRAWQQVAGDLAATSSDLATKLQQNVQNLNPGWDKPSDTQLRPNTTREFSHLKSNRKMNWLDSCQKHTDPQQYSRSARLSPRFVKYNSTSPRAALSTGRSNYLRGPASSFCPASSKSRAETWRSLRSPPGDSKTISIRAPSSQCASSTQPSRRSLEDTSGARTPSHSTRGPSVPPGTATALFLSPSPIFADSRPPHYEGGGGGGGGGGAILNGGGSRRRHHASPTVGPLPSATARTAAAASRCRGAAARLAPAHARRLTPRGRQGRGAGGGGAATAPGVPNLAQPEKIR